MKKVLFPVITEFDAHLPYYFAGVGCVYQQEDINRPGGYPDYQWIQCRGGRGELILNGTKHIIEANQGILLFPDEPHEYSALGGEWTVDWIIFKGTDTGKFIREMLRAEHSGVYYVTHPHIIAEKISGLYGMATAGHNQGLVCSSIVYSILTDLMRLTSLTCNASITDKLDRINSVLNYIDGHYAEQISLGELADIAELTPQYLCTTFKKYTSQTLFEYINMVRIRKSKEYLFDKKMQIKEIAQLAGFNDTSYFCSMFRKIEKMSPMEFRALHN